MVMSNKLSATLWMFFFSTLCLISCGGSEEPSNNSGDPTNLTVEIIIADDDSGNVSVQAQATNAILYEFAMGDANNSTGSSNDGVFEFQYENTGNYVVEVKAYGNSGRFIKEQKQISIASGDPSTTGDGYVTPISYEGWNLVCNDEFDGSVLDGSTWSYQNGNGCPNLCGWGNNELEYYRPENSWIANGLLTIEARKELFETNEYTSTKLISQGKKSFLYGRVDVRAKLPKGKGLWPAIWMLGNSISSVGWPKCGEIDIMEMVGGNSGEKTTHGTAHWEDANGQKAISGGSRTQLTGLDEKFHVFSLIWNESEIQWLLDDVVYHTLDITTPGTTAFHSPFYMILNVAVGGTWPGNPTSATEFPTQMQLDYVRVFQEQ